MVKKPGRQKHAEMSGRRRAVRYSCILAWGILAFFVLANLANLTLPPFSQGFSSSPAHSLHVYYPPTSGSYLGNPNNFQELDLNITIVPGPLISEGMKINLSAFGVVSPNLAKGLDQVVVNFLAAKGPNGEQRIVEGSSGWGVTLKPGPLQGYQIPFIVAGSMWLSGNSTMLSWPAGTGGIDYHPIVEAQYDNGSRIDATTNDSIHVYSSQELHGIWQGGVEFSIAVATVFSLVVGVVYRFAGVTSKEDLANAIREQTDVQVKPRMKVYQGVPSELRQSNPMPRYVVVENAEGGGPALDIKVEVMNLSRTTPPAVTEFPLINPGKDKGAGVPPGTSFGDKIRANVNWKDTHGVEDGTQFVFEYQGIPGAIY